MFRAIFVVFAASVLSSASGQGVLPPLTPGSPIALAGAPLALAVSDLDSDGDRDIVAAISGLHAVQPVLVQGGVLTPSAVSLLLGGGVPTAVSAGFLNSDPYPDLVVGTTAAPFLQVGLSVGPHAWVFTAGPSIPAAPSSLVLGDATADGITDLAVTFGVGATAAARVYAGALGGGFSQVLSIPAQSNANFPTRVAFGDATGDGLLDLFVGVMGQGVFLRVNLGGGIFGASQTVGVFGASVNDIFTEDLTGDGMADVVALTGVNTFGLAGGVIYVATGGGGFTPGGSFPYGGGGGGAHVAGVACDVDRDGLLDIVCSTGAGGIVEGFPGDGFGGLIPPSGGVVSGPFQVSTPGAAHRMAVVALEGDLDDDIVVADGLGALIPLFVTPTLRVQGPAILGTILPVRFDAPAEATRAFTIAGALAPLPAHALGDGRVIPLGLVDANGAFDPVFMLTTTPGCGGACFGFLGTLDAAGRSHGGVYLPSLPALAGLPLFFAGVAFDVAAPLGISHISNGQFVVLH